MPLIKPTIVIFDMDGTTVRHLNPRLIGFMEWLDDTVFKISKLWTWLGSKKTQNPLEYLAKQKAFKPPKSIIVHRAIHKFRRKPVEMLVEPCPGVIEVLEYLKSKNIPLALASNGLGKGYGDDVVKKFDLGQYFPVTVFREDVRKSKPNPEGIMTAIHRLGLTPTANDVIWHIGDRHKDVTATQAADKLSPAKILPLAYGINASIAVIEKGYGPNHILMTYQDMLDILKRLSTKKTSKPPLKLF